MHLHRREFLQLAAIAAAAPAWPRVAAALDYPTKPVRILVGFGPGAAPDVLARMMAQWLSDRMARPFIVENKPGGTSTLATEAVINADPDGYTLLMVATAWAINPTLYKKPDDVFDCNLAPVAGLSREPNVMVVNPAFPAKTVVEFIAYAKAHPGTINMASPGVGTAPHMAGELFKVMTGVAMTHVAYRSSPAVLTDLFGGQVQVYFAPVSTSLEHIKAGRLRALAVTTAARAAVLPDVPPLADVVPGYEMTAWYGLAAPKKTPAEIIDRLNTQIDAGLADPAVTARLAALGSSAFAVSPAEFGQFIADETVKWAKVVKSARIEPD